MGLKYVMFEMRSLRRSKDRDPLVRRWPFVFPASMVHADVMIVIQTMARGRYKFDLKPISAGDISLFGGEVRCSGESTTLRLQSLGEEDAEIIKMFDYVHGLVDG